jgi:SAM-dependent methyltransferase
MRHEALAERAPGEDWVGWCCSYCSGPLVGHGAGLFCAAEGRWFATLDGVHRLLPAERRIELLPFLELYNRSRRDEGFRASVGLPEVPPGHPQENLWRRRAHHFRAAMARAEQTLGPGPWRVLEVGAGSAWVSLRLRERGHDVVATDVNLDPDDGLLAPNRLEAGGQGLPRAEAEMEALPIEPGRFDLVVVAGALHHVPRLGRALVEVRRVMRRDGLLLVWDSPVYRGRADGEAMVAARMRALERRYRLSVPRESQAGYLVLGELPGVFGASGFTLEVEGWPGPPVEWLRDVLEWLKHGRRTARFPILLGRRDDA